MCRKVLRRALARAEKVRLIMLTTLILWPRSSRARRICQYACFPAPKTVRVLRFDLRTRRREEAKAVRNAVISSASTKPIGRPVLVMMASVPRGVTSPSFCSSEDSDGAASVTTV